MLCPHCGRAPGAASPPCPHCPAADASLPAVRGSGSGAEPGPDAGGRQQAVEPEVLAPQDDAASRSGGAWRREERIFFRTGTGGAGETGGMGGGHGPFGQFRFATWRGGTGATPGAMIGGDSCLPGIITLFLLVACAAQFGALAAVSFLFFYIIGSAIAMFVNLQRIMQGRPLNPWISRAVIWGACWLVTGWLSGGL